MIKKIVVIGLLAFVSYKSLSYYFFYTSSKKLASCPTAGGQAQAKEHAQKTREDLLASTKAWRCLKQKQNFAEAFFFKIHDGWLNPSVEYVNPPFTEAELNSEISSIDEAIKKDLIAFRNIYSEAFLKDYLANINLAKSDAPEIGYRRINDSLELMIPKLMEFKPESTKFATLKTQLAYSLSQVQLNNSEVIKLIDEANKKIARGDALLTKPKAEIRLHKQDILDIQKELDTFAFQLESTMRKQEELNKEILKTSDEIDMLYRLYS